MKALLPDRMQGFYILHFSIPNSIKSYLSGHDIQRGMIFKSGLFNVYVGNIFYMRSSKRGKLIVGISV
jgi:hypothetical protein